MERFRKEVSSPSAFAKTGWQVALGVTLDALADMYSGRDGPWIDELIEATINEFKCNGSGADSESAAREFFQDYRTRLHHH